MKEKGERGNRGGGLVWKREKGRGVLAKWPSSTPGAHPGQRQGGARAAAARRPPGHGCIRQEGGKKEGDEGVLLPSSP
jgi:hypothetical protein